MDASRIFISYRRDDTSGHAGRLMDRLASHFPGRVFMDIETIEPGVDFVDVIDKAVGQCEVLIVMIGREWLTATDADGRRRLDNPEDFVRVEIAAVLDRDIRVIPVLVEGATMPRSQDLPPDLAKLARRNALELSDARWVYDVDRLIETLEQVVGSRPAPSEEAVPAAPTAPAHSPSRSRRWVWMLGTLALAVLIVAGFWWSTRSRRSLPKAVDKETPGEVKPAGETRPDRPTPSGPTPSTTQLPPTTTEPSSSSEDRGFRVVELRLRADPFRYSGECPVKITFSGRISVAGGDGQVSYRFVRSDGASGPVETVRFPSPGSERVETTWTIGGPGMEFSGWEAIHTYDPEEKESNRASFEIRCK